jgi:hypothetical protein
MNSTFYILIILLTFLGCDNEFSTINKSKMNEHKIIRWDALTINIKGHDLQMHVSATFEKHKVIINDTFFYAHKLIPNTRVFLVLINNELFRLFNDPIEDLDHSEENEIIKTYIQNEIDLSFNCHGFTFTNGEYWLYDQVEVEKIISGMNYKEIKELQSDCVILFYNNNELVHSGIYNRNLEFKCKEGAAKRLIFGENISSIGSDLGYEFDEIKYFKK